MRDALFDHLCAPFQRRGESLCFDCVETLESLGEADVMDLVQRATTTCLNLHRRNDPPLAETPIPRAAGPDVIESTLGDDAWVDVASSESSHGGGGGGGGVVVRKKRVT